MKRKMGDILLDMEPLLEEMAIDQELQKGDILALISVYIDIHLPSCIEEYEEGGHPEFYYGQKKK